MDAITNNLNEYIAYAIALAAAADKIFLVALETFKHMRSAWRSTFPKHTLRGSTREEEEIIELIEEV